MITKYVENNLITEQVIKQYLLDKGHKKSWVEKNIDKYNQFINYLFYVTLFTKKLNTTDYITLDTIYIVSKLGTLKLEKIKCKQHRYITECLIDLGLIENKIYNTESVVRKSEYRFTYKAKKEGFSFLKDNFNINKKELELDIQKETEIDYQTPLIEQTKNQLNKLSINKNEVLHKINKSNIIKKENKYISYTYTLRNIICNDYTIVRHNNKGRMFNFFTMTPKIIRNEYLFCGKPLIELDINNCIPMLILEFLNMDNINKEELNDYINSFEKKSLHNNINNLFNINDAKIALIKYVYFDREKRNNKIKKYFSNRFPTIHKEILNFKKKPNYSNILYEKEAEIIIDEILNLCFKMDLPVLTIHDALFTNEDYIDKLKEIVDNKLNKVTKNIKLTYKIK